MYDTYVSNFYDGRHVKSDNQEFIFLSNSVLMNYNILTSYLSGHVIWKDLLKSNSQRKYTHKPLKNKQINRYFIRDTWPESIKKEFLWFLFQDNLSFTAKNMPEHSDYPLRQSIIKVFYLFKVQFKFDNDDVTGVFIQFNISTKQSFSNIMKQ